MIGGRPGSVAWGFSISYRYSRMLPGSGLGMQAPLYRGRALEQVLCTWSRQAFSGGGGRGQENVG